MPKQYTIHGIDLTAEGGVQRLLDFHRKQFGDAVMEANDGEPVNSTANAGEQSGEQGETFRAPSSQDELDRIIQKRLDRERSKFADYDDLKSRAEKLAEIEAAQKTAEEKQAEEIEHLRNEKATLEKDLAKKDRDILAQQVAADKGVALRWITGDTKEEMESSADQFLEDAKSYGAPKPPPGYVPSQGTGDPTPPTSSLDDVRERAKRFAGKK